MFICVAHTACAPPRKASSESRHRSIAIARRTCLQPLSACRRRLSICRRPAQMNLESHEMAARCRAARVSHWDGDSQFGLRICSFAAVGPSFPSVPNQHCWGSFSPTAANASVMHWVHLWDVTTINSIQEEEEGEGRRRETGRREKHTSRPHGDQQRLHVYASSGMI